MESVTNKFKEGKKVNTDFVIDSDKDADSDLDEEDLGHQLEIKKKNLNESEAEILLNLGLDPNKVSIEDLDEIDL